MLCPRRGRFRFRVDDVIGRKQRASGFARVKLLPLGFHDADDICRIKGNVLGLSDDPFVALRPDYSIVYVGRSSYSRPVDMVTTRSR